MHKQHVTLPVSDGTQVQCYTVVPDGGPHPGMILFQEAFGVNGHIRRVAEKLAGEGYVVIAPELFHRSAPAGYEASYGDFSVIAPHFQAITLEGLQSDSKACFDWLQGQKSVSKGKIGSIGFCLGGRVSFIANATVPLTCGISYYGGYLDQVAQLAEKAHGPHCFFWGGLDKHIPLETREKVTQAMDNASKPYINVVFSYADHAFNCDDRPSFNADASREAWGMAMAFLKNKFA